MTSRLFNFWLPDDLKDHLEKASNAKGISMSKYLKMLIATDKKMMEDEHEGKYCISDMDAMADVIIK